MNHIQRPIKKSGNYIYHWISALILAATLGCLSAGVTGIWGVFLYMASLTMLIVLYDVRPRR